MAADRTVSEDDIARLLAVTDVFEAFATSDDETERAVLAADLHERLDQLDAQPDAWHGLKELVGRVDDAVIAGLVRYSMERSEGQVREMLRDLSQEPERRPSRARSRRRDRDRGD